MIIVSSFDHAVEAFRRYEARSVISILTEEEGPAPSFPSLPAENHLRLTVDCSAEDSASGASSRCAALLEFAANWERKGPILVHCYEGVARSMAAAYILLCAAEPERSEQEIAEELRKAAPHADPNLLLISEADALLGRDDRMIEAVLDLTPCAGSVAEPIVTLPLAA